MIILKKKPHLFKIKNKQGKITDFKLNTVQAQIVGEIEKQIEEQGRARLIVVKGRQQGSSTVLMALPMSYVMTTPGFKAYTMAHDATTATDLFNDKIKFFFTNLHPAIKRVYKVKRDNVRQLMFEGELNSASITVGMSPRGSTLDYLHISEAGKMSMNNNLWQEMISGALPAAESALAVVIESTADGGLGAFYELVQASLRGENEFKTIFLSWTDSEEYRETPPDDDGWMEQYQALATKYKLYLDPMGQKGLTKAQFYWYHRKASLLKDEVKVQYPLDLDEAFISKSLTKFDIQTVRDAKAKAIKPIRTSSEGIEFYHELKPALYVLSIDPATGLGKDYTAIKVRFNDGTKYREFCKIRGKLSEQVTARIAVNLANWINQQGRCLIVQETNLASYLINYIRENYPDDLIYKRYIQDPSKQYDTLIPDYGFKTTGQNRDLIINNFVSQFEAGNIEVNSETELEEMLKFIWNDEKKRYEAQEPYHDDELFADFINLEGFNYARQYL